MATSVHRKFLSILLILGMLVSAISPAWAVSDAIGSTSAKHVIDPVEKLSTGLQEEIAAKDMVEVIIYLNDVFDSETFSMQAKQSYASRLTGYQLQRQIRRDLVTALQDHSHVTQRNILALLERSQLVEEYESFFIANVVYAKAAPAVIEAIAQMPEVRMIEKNETRYLIDVQPPETQAVGEDLLWHLEMIKANEVWGMGVDGTGTVVGVIDSGVDWNHPALKQAWRGYRADGEVESLGNWYDSVDSTTLPVDSTGHGTHVTGTIVGKDPATGFTTGVAPGAQWIAARVFGPGGGTTDGQLLRAGQWMLAPNFDPDLAPDVVNNSWGGGSMMSDWYRDVVRNWIAGGIVPVFAAGNQSSGEPIPKPGSIVNPGHYPESFAVGAVDNEMIRPDFSKRGPSTYGDETIAGWKPNVVAPGVGIVSTLPGNRYGSNTGTSMATPQVSGVALLMRSADASLSVDQIKTTLQDTALGLTDDKPTAKYSPNHDYGHGLIDAMEAVSSHSDGTGFFVGKVLKAGEDTTLPVITHTPPVQASYIGAEIDIEATVRDDVSVTDVRLLVQSDQSPDWIPLEMEQQTGDHQGGLYTGRITSEYMVGNLIRYRIEATDFGAHVGQTPDYEVSLSWGIVPGEYLESFEGSNEGWFFDSPWETGIPSLETEPRPVSGDKVLATVVGGEYGHDLQAVAISPPIDMRQTEQASLRFYHWYEFGISSYLTDYGRIYLSNDNGATKTLVDTFVGNSGKWQGLMIDLSEYANSETPVRAYFELTTNIFESHLGWYIDHLSVEGVDTTPPEAPTGLQAQGTLDGITLTWDPSLESDVKEYIVYRSETAGQEGQEIGRTSEIAFEDLNTVQGTTYYYTVKAVDFYNNISQPSEQISAQPVPVTVIIHKDFEADNGDFTLGQLDGSGNVWEWGSVAEGHGPGGTWDGSQNLWATGLGSNYGSRQTAWIESPVLSIPADGQVFLRFDHWYHFQRLSVTGPKNDYGQVLIKKADSAEWVNITPLQPGTTDTDRYGGPYSVNDSAWEKETISLDDYLGQDVNIRFMYVSDNSGTKAGWFIDNFSVIQLPQQPDTTSQAQDERLVLPLPEVETAVIPAEVTGVPLVGASVSVIETGVTVRNDSRTGNYQMRHRMSEDGETWTLKAEAYGYKSEIFESALADGQTVEHIFLLEPEDTGTIQVQVIDQATGLVIPGVTLRFIEDALIDPQTSDANGQATFSDIYVGDYTLHATATDYHPGQVRLTLTADQTLNVTVELQKFFGSPGELIHDDGSAEDSLVLNHIGNGLGLRFTPERYGKLVSASFFFWDSSFPTPGGEEISFGVFVPKSAYSWEQVGETIVKTDIVRGAWNTIDLQDLHFFTDQDFYVTTIQTKIGGQSPAVGIDETAASDRSYFFSAGSFIPMADQDVTGGLMIRARMLYETMAPVITNLEEVNYTNQSSLLVEGETALPGTIQIYVNNSMVTTVEAETTFSATVELTQASNTIYAVLQQGEVSSGRSNQVQVILDQVSPILDVVSPIDQMKLNQLEVLASGTASDDYFDELLINNQPTTVDEQGDFETLVSLVEGENVITFQAKDLAGNITEESRTVIVNLGGDLALTNLQPAEDVTLVAGESVTVSFDGPTGGTGTYRLVLPTTQAGTEIDALPMVEGPAGTYQATYTAPADTIFRGATVDFDYVSPEGERAMARASGTISIMEVIEEPVEPEPIALIHLKPADDVVLQTGESTVVSFEGPIGGQASYVLSMNQGASLDALPGVTMEETSPGYYEATVTAKADVQFEKAKVHFFFVAADERRLDAEAPGSISVRMPEPPTTPVTITRVAGANRYETSVAMSQKTFDSADTVVLATGLNFPDALVGGIYAERLQAPVLLVTKDMIPEDVMAEIKRLGATDAKLLGGPAVVSEAVEAQLTDAGLTWERVAGDNRYQTAIEISRRARASDSTHVYLVSGLDFPDALSIVPVAAIEDHSILMSGQEQLDPATLQALQDWNTRTVTIMGGEGVIQDSVVTQLEDLGIQVDRNQGTNRFGTNIVVAERYFDQPTAAVGASGMNFPDALVSTVYAALNHQPIVLIHPAGLADVTRTYLSESVITDMTLMGGTNVIPVEIELEIYQLLLN